MYDLADHRNYWGKNKIWCMLHNYGQRPGMYGDMAMVAKTPAAAQVEPNSTVRFRHRLLYPVFPIAPHRRKRILFCMPWSQALLFFKMVGIGKTTPNLLPTDHRHDPVLSKPPTLTRPTAATKASPNLLPTDHVTEALR